MTLITRKVKSQLRSGKFRELKNAGQGAWQSQAILRGYELLGRSLGLFHDKIDVDAADNAIMETLIQGRRRAAGLPEDEEEPETLEDAPQDPKPN